MKRAPKKATVETEPNDRKASNKTSSPFWLHFRVDYFYCRHSNLYVLVALLVETTFYFMTIEALQTNVLYYLNGAPPLY
jgi:hypothetical protein